MIIVFEGICIVIDNLIWFEFIFLFTLFDAVLILQEKNHIQDFLEFTFYKVQNYFYK
jgi:hypothetical protein